MIPRKTPVENEPYGLLLSEGEMWVLAEACKRLGEMLEDSACTPERDAKLHYLGRLSLKGRQVLLSRPFESDPLRTYLCRQRER